MHAHAHTFLSQITPISSFIRHREFKAIISMNPSLSRIRQYSHRRISITAPCCDSHTPDVVLLLIKVFARNEHTCCCFKRPSPAGAFVFPHSIKTSWTTAKMKLNTLLSPTAPPLCLVPLHSARLPSEAEPSPPCVVG